MPDGAGAHEATPMYDGAGAHEPTPTYDGAGAHEATGERVTELVFTVINEALARMVHIWYRTGHIC